MFFSVICIINMYINIYAYDNINISDVKLYINNELYKFNKKPININGYTYINIDDVKKIFGYDYHIEEDNLILNYNEQGNVINIDNLNEAYIYNNTIYVPVRLVANRNKCDIYWDIGENSINLNYNISDVFGREIIKTIVYYSKN